MLEGEQTLNARDYRVFPWAYVIERRLGGHCRRRHQTRPELWPEHARAKAPLCPPLVKLVAVRGYRPAHVAAHLGVSPQRLEEVLGDALRWAWRRVSEEVNEIADATRRRPPATN